MDEKLTKSNEKMTKTLDALISDYNGIRAGRANPHILDKVMVDYYGQMTPVANISNINIPESRIIAISPWEPKMAEEIAKAISTSDIGINPVVDGGVVRLVMPELTEDRRKELVKDIKKRGEDAKVAIRNIRRDGNDMIKKLKGSELSEDSIKDLEDELQKMTDDYIKQIDSAIDSKSKEILTI